MLEVIYNLINSLAVYNFSALRLFTIKLIVKLHILPLFHVLGTHF